MKIWNEIIRFVSAECGAELNSTNGTITSPGFPSSYLPHQHCLWTIHRLPDHYIKIMISNFDTPLSLKCRDDYLKPQHGKFIYKRRICGHFTLIKYIIQEGNSTYFQFHSHLPTSSVHTGFNMTYEQVPIDEISTHELETVYVDDYSFPYQRNRWLSWTKLSFFIVTQHDITWHGWIDDWNHKTSIDS